RVVLEGLRAVDEGVEDLVVPRRAHVELLPDRALLRAGVLPPLALEVEDAAITLRQAARVIGLRGVECVTGDHGRRLLGLGTAGAGASLGEKPQRCHLTRRQESRRSGRPGRRLRWGP